MQLSKGMAFSATQHLSRLQIAWLLEKRKNMQISEKLTHDSQKLLFIMQM